MTARRGVLAGLVVVALLAGCTSTPDDPDGTSAPDPTSSAPPATQEPGAPPPSPTEDFPDGPELPAATSTPHDVLTDLTTPWGIAFLPTGAALITLRDPAQVVLLTASGATTLTGPGAEELAAGTDTQGEGGLLGVALSPDVAEDHVVHLYRTTPDGNEVVRTVLDAHAGTLSALETVLDGIPAASNHNGGRIAFGPDGYLYVATGDAGDESAAQDPDALNGKILRITADGQPAPGNPTEGSPVWSLGHRNVQGLGWDDTGRMFASEFGQNAFDELNVVVAGGNYGWPEVEGMGDVEGYVNPVAVWSTDVASPSGIGVVGDVVFLAALRGQRLLSVTFFSDGPGETGETLVGELGRLRDVTVGPDGALWLLTQNTDGRGDPRAGDDRVVRVAAP